MTDEERRAADQDAAIEQAFLDGTLPEEDRRAYEAKRDAKAAKAVAESVTEAEPSEAVAAPTVAPVIEVDPSAAAIAAAGVGSVFEKTASGWNVKYVDGGTIIHVQGATIADAIASHGAQVEHPDIAAREAFAAQAREAATALVIQ